MSRRPPAPGPPPLIRPPRNMLLRAGRSLLLCRPSPQGSPLRAASCPPGSPVSVEPTAPEAREPATTHQRPPQSPKRERPRGRASRMRARAPGHDARPALPASPFRPPATPTEFERALRARSAIWPNPHGVVVVARPQAQSPSARRRPGGRRQNRTWRAPQPKRWGVRSFDCNVTKGSTKARRSTNGTTANRCSTRSSYATSSPASSSR